MRSASARLRSLDLDGDGALSSDEVPASIGLSLARVADDAGMNPQQPQPAAMEFLGDLDQFRQFDADGNGFLDAAEAEKAEPEA
jgi:hypothetical protein